jgi:hypothetical protein
MSRAFAWFIAAVGVMVVVDVVLVYAIGISFSHLSRSGSYLVLFATLLQVGVVLTGCLGYFVATLKRRVFPTLNRAFLSGATFPFMLVPIVLGFHYWVHVLSPLVSALFFALALTVGAISSLVIRGNAA